MTTRPLQEPPAGDGSRAVPAAGPRPARARRRARPRPARRPGRASREQVRAWIEEAVKEFFAALERRLRSEAAPRRSPAPAPARRARRREAR